MLYARIIIYICIIFIIDHMCLERIRERMEKEGMDGFLLPRSDPHMNEYLHPRYEHITHITGFTGSNAILLVLKDEAFVYTDGRYSLQIKKELYEGIQFAGTERSVIREILLKKKVQKLGLIPEYTTNEILSNLLGDAKNKIDIFNLPETFIDEIFPERPQITQTDLVCVAPEGADVNERIQSQMNRIEESKGNIDMLILCDMDEIAWCTYLRGKDIPMSRLFYSFMCISEYNATLYTDAKIPKDYKADIKVQKYKEFYEDIKKIEKMNISTSISINMHLSSELGKNNTLSIDKNIMMLKAVKNKKEIDGFRKANIKDSVYLCMLFGQLQKKIENGEMIGEKEAAEMLLNIKRKDSEFICPSFETISSFGTNAAVIHYTAKDNSIKIEKNNLYLIDSGSQYTMGTTDITRTISFGKPTPEQKKHYTALIKGHISLENLPFPDKSSLECLSVIVRQHVWALGLNYAHGTGHGVGYMLNVHESPPSIDGLSLHPAKEGMVVTNEPGIYLENSYGIRHENLLVVQKHPKIENFYILENITPAPLHLSLLDLKMLTDEEIAYINERSKWTKDLLTPYLFEHSFEGYKWLIENTKMISREE